MSFEQKKHTNKRRKTFNWKLCFVAALHAKALYYQETLCRKEDIQRFLSTLVTKRPEVGEDGHEVLRALIANL